VHVFSLSAFIARKCFERLGLYNRFVRESTLPAIPNMALPDTCAALSAVLPSPASMGVDLTIHASKFELFFSYRELLALYRDKGRQFLPMK